jgi:hypothetical protein
VENLVIDCSNVASSNTNSRGLSSDNASDFVARNVSFVNGGQMQVYATGLITNHTYQGIKSETQGYGILVNEPDAGSSGLYIWDCEFDMQGVAQSDGVEVNAPTNGFRTVRVSRTTARNAFGNSLQAGIGFGFANVQDIILTECAAIDCSMDGFHFEDETEDFTMIGCHAFGCTHDTTNASAALAILEQCRRGNIIGFIAANSTLKTQTKSPISISSATGTYNDDITIIGGQVSDGPTYNVSVNSSRRVRLQGIASNNPNTLNSGSGAHFAIRKLGASLCDVVEISGCTAKDGTNAAQSLAIVETTALTSGRFFNNDFSGCATARPDYTTGNIYDSRGNIFSASVVKRGTFTPTANSTFVVNNANVDDIDLIVVQPRNAAARTLGAAIVTSVVRGTSFTVTFPTIAAGTEIYSYIVM